MSDDTLSFAQHAIARAVSAWCAREGIPVTRSQVRELATAARAEQTMLRLALDDIEVEVHPDHVVLRMPHRVIEWRYVAEDDVAGLVGKITRVIETG